MKKILFLIISILVVSSCQHMDLDERTMIVEHKKVSPAYNLAKYSVIIQGAYCYRTIQFTAPIDAYVIGDTLTFQKKRR